MRRLILAAAVFLIIIQLPCRVSARPPKGFHTGPYLTALVGVMQADFDRDQVTGRKAGWDFEPTFGILFGWNISDRFSAELQGLYATNENSGRREHIAGAGVFGKWTIVTDTLTDFKSLRILPFLKMGMSTRFAKLPGSPDADDDSMSTVGWGPSAGAGMAFLWHKYFYFGVDLQGDFLLFEDKRQTVGGTPGVLVYKGGLHPSFMALAILGVHY